MTATDARERDPHLLLLLGGGGIAPAAALEAAEQVTGRLSVIWYDAVAPTAAVAGVEERWRTRFEGSWIATADARRLVDLAMAVHRREPLAGIATFGEALIGVQAQAQRLAGLPGNPVEAVRVAQSKLDQRRRLRDAGVETLRFHELFDEADIPAAAAAVGFPAVLKPVRGAASFLVSKVRDEDQLRQRLRAARASVGKSPLIDPEPLFLLEELLEGDYWYDEPGLGDYCSVESLVEDGRTTHVAITDKLPLYEGFVEAGDIVPSALPSERQRQVLAHTDRIIEAVGIRWGATHTELKLTPRGPACIELNARLGGATGHFVRGATGTDIAVDVLRLALGLPAVGDYRPRRHALFRSLAPPRQPAVIVRQTPREVLFDAVPELHHCKTRYSVGTRLDPDQAYSPLTYLVTGDDLAACRAAAEKVERMHEVELEPLDWPQPEVPRRPAREREVAG
jgi:hypothetical protein